MLHRLSGLVLALSLVLAPAACAPGFAGGNGRVSKPETQVRVRNHNWSDMNVYLVRGGTRARLGTVTSMGEGVFSVPRALMLSGSDVRLLADPIGSTGVFVTETILVNPGQTIDLMLENNLNLSSYSVW